MPNPTRTSRCAGSSWRSSRSCRSRWRCPRCVLGTDAGLPVHTARHLGSFDVALGGRVPLRRVDARRASPACCRSSPRWSRASSGRRCSTSSPGTPRALGEAHHVTDFVGLVVVWLLSRPAHPSGAARVTSAQAPRSRSARSSSRWSSRSPRPPSRTRRCSRPSRRPAAVYDTSPKAITLRFSEPVEVVARRHPRCTTATATGSSPASPSTRTATAERGHDVDAEARRRHLRRHVAGHVGRLASDRRRASRSRSGRRRR